MNAKSRHPSRESRMNNAKSADVDLEARWLTSAIQASPAFDGDEGAAESLANDIAMAFVSRSLTPALDLVERLARALQTIHGVFVPLPNRATPAEYARVIAAELARLENQ